MTVRGRKPGKRDRASGGAASGDSDGDAVRDAAAYDTALKRLAAAGQGRVTLVRRWLAKYRDVPVVDVIFGTLQRDRQAAGWVMSSALAFRLFLFFLPLLLLTIGVAGFAAEIVDARSANRAAGISGGLAK